MTKYEEEYVLVNGIEHFLLHYPKTPGTPVLLFLHGGPGNFESLFAYELDKAWKDLFTQVHWDQRGAGKTLRKNGKAGWPESTDQMLCDLHGVVGYLQEKYRTEKIVILGHSWGTVLGSLYALKHPENILAYIGTGQVVSIMEGERTAYRSVLAMARGAETDAATLRGSAYCNKKHLRQLSELGDYPPEDPEQLLKRLPRMRKIQEAYDNGPVSGSGLLDMIKMIRRSPSFRWSDLLSFLQIMKVNRALQLQMFSFDLGKFPPRYKIPVHYILGEADTITPMSMARTYYDTVEAPGKSFAVIPKAGHNAVLECPEEFAHALRAVRETL